jgi:hypothetical protein
MATKIKKLNAHYEGYDKSTRLVIGEKMIRGDIAECLELICNKIDEIVDYLNTENTLLFSELKGTMELSDVNQNEKNYLSSDEIPQHSLITSLLEEQIKILKEEKRKLLNFIAVTGIGLSDGDQTWDIQPNLNLKK